jgi:hypothetical protein
MFTMGVFEETALNAVVPPKLGWKEWPHLANPDRSQ